MSLKFGLVGLPNVGKSTLFNSLTNNQVPAENYPFCTIDPNIGTVPVRDKRIDKLTEISNSKKTIYPTIEFVDIAGLVKGASSGEGLGNKFLGNILETDAIVQVVRLFENKDIIHVHENIDPKRDIEIINFELIMKDLEILEKHIQRIEKIFRVNKAYQNLSTFLNALNTHLKEGKIAKLYFKDNVELYKNDEIFQAEIKQIQLLTNKPFIYVANVDENNANINHDKLVELLGVSSDTVIIPLSVKLEYEISTLDENDKSIFLTEYNLSETGLDKLTKIAYSSLDLITFLTTGEDESRGWTINKGTNAKLAAATIHNDISDKFISAEVVSYEDFVEFGGYKGCKDNGKMRIESKDYIVKDGDIIEFRHNA